MSMDDRKEVVSSNSMAHSSCSNTIDSMRYERVLCTECGREAPVLMSKSVRNPGRLYYGCQFHGWLKWVVPATMETEADSQHMRRRFTTERCEAGASIAIESKKNEGINWKGFFWPLLVINLALVAAILLLLLIWLVKRRW